MFLFILPLLHTTTRHTTTRHNIKEHLFTSIMRCVASELVCVAVLALCARPTAAGQSLVQIGLDRVIGLDALECAEYQAQIGGVRTGTKWPLRWPFRQYSSETGGECVSDSAKCHAPRVSARAGGVYDGQVYVNFKACSRANDAWYATITTLPMAWFVHVRQGDGSLVLAEGGTVVDLQDYRAVESNTPNLLDGGPRWTALPDDFEDRVRNSGTGYADVANRLDMQITDDDGIGASAICRTGGGTTLSPCLTYSQVTRLMLENSAPPNAADSSQQFCQTCTLGDATCLGDPDMVGGTDSTPCQHGITDSCIQNAFSVSAPVCYFIGGGVALSEWGFAKCINHELMRAAGLGSFFDAKEYRSTGDTLALTQDINWLGLKLPSTILNTAVDQMLAVHLVEGSAKQCSDEWHKPAAVSVDGANDFSILDFTGATGKPLSLHDRSAVLQFKELQCDEFLQVHSALIGDNAVCHFVCGKCGHGAGTDMLTFKYDKDMGVAMCRPCIETAEIRVGIEECDNREFSVCQECDAHHGVVDRKCVPCPKNNPYRPTLTAGNMLTPTWTACTTCGIGFKFDSVHQQCEALNRFSLSNLEGEEEYRIGNDDYTSTGFQVAPAGFYVDIDSDTIRDCDSPDNGCGSHQYKAFCGHHFDQGMYTKSTPASLPTFLPKTQQQSYGTDTRRQVVRSGVCTDCIKCTPPATYNTANPGEFNAQCSSAQNSPGLCTQCRTTCDDDTHYLAHEHPSGCNQSHARSDYSCELCPFAMKENGQYFLVVGCGTSTFERWTTSTLVTSADKLRPGSYTCDYTTTEDSGCMHMGVPHKRRIEQPRFWGMHTDLLPYCPVGWHVDAEKEECSDVNLAQKPWNAECCTQCQATQEGFMKSAQYRTCSGATAIDTQSYVAACESGRYRVESVADAPAVCHPCTVCG